MDDQADSSSDLILLRQQIADLQAEVESLRAERRFGIVFDTSEKEPAVLELESHFAALEPVVGLSCGRGPAVTLVRGENLHALSALTCVMPASVDIIYIDPPYNTGRSDFIYADSYVEAQDVFRHSTWLAFMDQRLSLAYQLMKDGATLFASIDDNEQAQLKLLLEKHFGPGSVKTLVVQMSEAAGMKMAVARASGSIPKLKEYVLVARKNAPVRLFIDPIPKSSWDTSYARYLEGLTVQARERIRELTQAPPVAAAQCAEVEELLAPVTYISARSAAIAQGVDPSDKKAMNAWRNANAWRIAQDTNGSGSIQGLVREREADGGLPAQAVFPVLTRTGRLYLALTKNARTVLLADDNLMTHPGDLWLDIKTTALSAEGGVTFKNGKKPMMLLERLIRSAPQPPDALVLDFFAGSGSTANAVAQLNAHDGGRRRCISVTNDDGDICSGVTIPRLRGVLTGALADGRQARALPGRLSVLDVVLAPRIASSVDKARDMVREFQPGFIALATGADMTHQLGSAVLGLVGDQAHLVLASHSRADALEVSKLWPEWMAEHAFAGEVCLWAPSSAEPGFDEYAAQLFPGCVMRVAEYGLYEALQP